MTAFLQFDPGAAASDWSSVPVDRATSSRSVASVASVAADTQIRAGIAALSRLPTPSYLSPAAWEKLLCDVHGFANDWLIEALELGWPVLDLFGCPPRPSAWTPGLMGLVPLLNGRPVAAITANAATILNRSGATNVFYRQAPGCGQPFDRSRAFLLWDAYAREVVS